MIILKSDIKLDVLFDYEKKGRGKLLRYIFQDYLVNEGTAKEQNLNEYFEDLVQNNPNLDINAFLDWFENELTEIGNMSLSEINDIVRLKVPSSQSQPLIHLSGENAIQISLFDLLKNMDSIAEVLNLGQYTEAGEEFIEGKRGSKVEAKLGYKPLVEAIDDTGEIISFGEKYIKISEKEKEITLKYDGDFKGDIYRNIGVSHIYTRKVSGSQTFKLKPSGDLEKLIGRLYQSGDLDLVSHKELLYEIFVEVFSDELLDPKFTYRLELVVPIRDTKMMSVTINKINEISATPHPPKAGTGSDKPVGETRNVHLPNYLVSEFFSKDYNTNIRKMVFFFNQIADNFDILRDHLINLEQEV